MGAGADSTQEAAHASPITNHIISNDVGDAGNVCEAGHMGCA